ncbi:MAG: DUF4445 domain-containing protein, partial [Actinobacteria bacterium]|nr:DUF4445 domain-containing protein [Actinomycetota bacterium]
MGKIFFPQYARYRKEGIEIEPGKSIMEHIKKAGGIEIFSECGGIGVCGSDIVRIESGLDLLSPLSISEQKFLKKGKLKKNQRLACQAKIIDDKNDIVLFISNIGTYTVLADIIKRDTELDPFVYSNGQDVFYFPDKKIDKYKGSILGLAIDIGTTTVVMQVINLENGDNVGSPIAFKNPQIAYGNDVITRIGYTINNKGGLQELQESVVSAINENIKELESGLGLISGEISNSIYDAVVVGNSTMKNIFFGRDVKSLGLVPFEAADKSPVLINSNKLGLEINGNGMVYGPAIIGGHAGADCLADVVATRIYLSPEISMIIDIGTNGEVAIGNDKKIMTASCAAGGAYEGYQISCGTGAIAGAITELNIDKGKISYSTIGNKPPVGICGSGVIDLLAQLYKSKIMNERTRINKPFNIYKNMYITQEDINQLIIAKAGLRTDQDLLIKYFGVSAIDVDKIYLAGAFGNYMNIENAIAIGLLPGIEKQKFIRFGNGALAGAIDMLISRKIRNDSEKLAKSIV